MDIYADTTNVFAYADDDKIKGFTTNPTIFKNAGITDGAKAAVTLLDDAKGKPVSIDGPNEKFVKELGSNAIPKIPVPLYTELPFRYDDRPVNFTAVCSYVQLDVLKYSKNFPILPDDIISVFCGRIMDTGTTPLDFLLRAHDLGARVLWASTREIYSVRMAERIGCDIITLTPALIDKLDGLDEHLDKVAARTLKQFHDDSRGMW